MEYRKIITPDILPLICEYLKSINLNSFAKKLEKMGGLDL